MSTKLTHIRRLLQRRELQEDGAGHELEKVKACGEAQRNSKDSAKMETSKGVIV